MARIDIGLSAELSHTVTSSDAAERWANELPVLATPILLWLAEVTCMRALEEALAPSEMTLGLTHEMHHLAPTPVGDHVRVFAELEAVLNGRLSFRVRAHDSEDRILDGKHTRALIDRDRFMRRVELKQDRLVTSHGLISRST